MADLDLVDDSAYLRDARSNRLGNLFQVFRWKFTLQNDRPPFDSAIDHLELAVAMASISRADKRSDQSLRVHFPCDGRGK